jgi:hypothetical protein
MFAEHAFKKHRDGRRKRRIPPYGHDFRDAPRRTHRTMERFKPVTVHDIRFTAYFFSTADVLALLPSPGAQTRPSITFQPTWLFRKRAAIDI